jgi:predicted nucleotidyltransferase
MMTGTHQTQQARQKILERVKHMIHQQLSGKQAKVYLFGSWARSEEKRSSDIDIAIEFETNDEPNRRTLIDIRHTLEESTIPYRMDIVDLNTADNFIIQKVREEGILWDVQAND